MDLQALKDDVLLWVDRCFDYIPLRVAEQLTNGALCEHIDLSGYDEEDDGEPPYPVRGTLFHYRERGHADFIEAAKKAGFLVIENVPEFDGVMLGLTGVGCSVYKAHWIPLYVELFRKGEFDGVSFDLL